ncbi:MAG: GGDEF domain-containing protein [Lachnospiraceae bacterium]|nr:GGDEF domain-containing protein [Lachnospiraceae bacterium]
MGKLFSSDNMEDFLEILHKPVRSREELVVCVRDALSCVASEMQIGRVTVNMSVPQSQLRAQIDNFTYTLYEGNREKRYEPIALSYRTGDGGTVIINFFANAGYTWSPEEFREIRIIGRQVFAVFSQMMMGNLLTRAMQTDLAMGVPNLAGFMAFAGQLFEQGKLEEYHAVYLNIHNFKYVNKVLPHMQADEVMKIYAHMLTRVLGADEMAARLGGDNFVALVRQENAEKFIRFINNVDITYQNEEDIKKFSFSATVGASALIGLKKPDEVMMRCSIAYQVARQSESTGVVYFNDEIYRAVMQQKEIIARFHKAIQKKEFLVYYQPKVTTLDKKICGAEALIRWKAGEKLLPPVEFVPILEKEGSICKLDFYVLDGVCALLGRCKQEGLPYVKISVNFSRKHVENPNLVKEIIETIDRHQVPHEFIEIELTESEDFRDYIVMSKLIDELRAANISTSIDDFGTGYSSLNMLKMTNVDLLKIDKSFVPFEEEERKKDIIMFENIARLAKELGIKIIAEGVETEQQYEYLAEAGCDMIQGHFFDKALPEEEFLERMRIGHY